MDVAVYNLGIPKIIANSTGSQYSLRTFACAFLLVVGLVASSPAADWNTPEQQLARKIVAVTGPGAVALSVENRSSLGKRDSEIIQNGIRSALEGVGLRFVDAEQAAATIAISLSENTSSYVWVAEIRQGAAEPAVVLVSAERPTGSVAAHESVPLSLRKTSLWSQSTPILDVAVLEESVSPTHIAVLDAEKVALYRWQGGKWQEEQALAISHAHPWPRDLRGRLIPAKDHLLDVYLPGVTCHSTAAPPMSLTCRDTDDPWPLVPAALIGGTFSSFPATASTATGSATIPAMNAFYASTRNFFTGALIPGMGRTKAVPKFYSAAFLPRNKYLLWLFAGTDGHVHLLDGMSDQIARFDWGSDLTGLKTTCGAGWQILATNPDATSDAGSGDSVRAYEFPDRDPVAVSAPIDFPGSGTITALWAEAKGDTAIVVTKNRDTGNYEAFRLAVVCTQ